MSKKKNDIEPFKTKTENEVLTLYLIGEITQNNAANFKLNFTFLKDDKIKKVILDFNEVTNYDTYLVVFLNSIQKFCDKKKKEIFFQNISEDLQRFINVFKKKPILPATQFEKISPLKVHITEVGDKTYRFFKEVYNIIEFFGELTNKLIIGLFKPSKIRWKDFPEFFTSAGVNALPISALIVFLIGLVTGYQGANQLKQFGADIFIADLIGISLTRTLVPMLVAILVAGRSGSAYAAEIGTMRVSDEVDALTTMGFDVTYFLVIPRVLAVVVAMPILVIICDLIGVAGGLIAALGTLDITITSFTNRLEMSLGFGDVFSGVFKSIVFAYLIASIGCFKGLQAKGGASAVGKYTTSAVVAGVFLIILTDAIFTFLFQSIGI